MTAVTSLPDWQRSPVFLVYVEQLSYQDAANVLDIPLGTVMSRLAAAKTALAAMLNPAAPRLPQDRSYHD
jgi:RNA polymerase sigma-70 factor, ECF subfamily